ncbi:mechanosensitive ion channel [Stieleria sp. JC731]|uniref:mechanosensitive ion channel domain-containing protein n=1 Tax=Pirellulaceae TaxID=2691357 RepID=UPI001E4F2C86|nr:mechanosensitive ion channel domain-containing protein [Stieleria sp. JC731]MCC9602533.1 mechanosensitive ion channel [Stieleria sp. JC731]
MRRHGLSLFCFFALVVFNGFSPTQLFAQLTLPEAKETPTVVEPVDDGLTVAAIDKELVDVEANSQLEEALKGRLVESLKRAKDSLAAVTANQEATKRFQSMLQQAPVRQGQLEDSIKQLAEKKVTVDENQSTTALTTKLATVTNEITSTAKRVSDLTSEPTRRRIRLTEIPELISKAEQQASEAKTLLEQPPAENASELERRVQKNSLRAKVKEQTAVAEALRAEQAAYMATAELLPLERQLAEATTQQLRVQAEKLQAVIAARQQQAAEETTTDMRKAVDAVPEALRDHAIANIKLAERNQELLAIEENAEIERLDVQAVYDDVQADMTTSEERIKAVGLTDALGLILRKQREEAVTLRSKYQPRADLTKKLNEYQIAAFQLEDNLEQIDQELSELEAATIDWKATSIPWGDLTREEAEWVLLRRRKDLIDTTLQSQNRVLQTMVVIDTQRRKLVKEVDRFTEFVDQHLFWTRSAPAFSVDELSRAPAAIKWVADPRAWQSVLGQVLATISSYPLKSFILTVAVIGLLLGRSRIRRVIDREGDIAHRSDATYSATLIALLGTVADSLCWPLVFLTFSFLLTATGTADSFVRGLGFGFGVVALYVASRELLRQICREKGLAMAHFDWGDTFRKYLRRHLRWYTLLGSLCVLVMAGFHEHPDTATRALATRIAATSLFILTAVFHHIIMRSKSPLHGEVVRHNPESNLYHFRKMIWVVAIAIPIVFGILAMAGYLDTTSRLGRSLQSTFLLLVVVVLTSGLISRWMMLKKRDLARQKAKELRARRAAEMQADASSPTAAAKEAGIVLHEEDIDFGAIDQQSRQTSFVISSILAIVGLGYIWSDVIPALKLFDEWAITIGSGEEAEKVSVLDAVIASISIAVTIYITRVLPGLFDLLVLGRTSLDSGARYAISTLLRYALIIFGAVFVMNLLSVPYDKLGWLLAAASVGLGFGLQEIVANFISGIILLLERPVRVGDVVTIDDTTGIVSRIQMRATTVTNWDRKELVIPNKDLITQKLLNWSLTNVVNRLTLKIGVAYGTDPNQVRRILFDVVTSHPEVMVDPAPLINFESFGDSSLDFVIRLYLEKLDNRIEITHQLNTAIANALSKANIEIPFPQRDVNFSFSDGTDIKTLGKNFGRGLDGCGDS